MEIKVEEINAPLTQLRRSLRLQNFARLKLKQFFYIRVNFMNKVIDSPSQINAPCLINAPPLRFKVLY